MTAYYNEIDEYCAQWLRNLIAAKLIAYGHVDTRSIVDVQPADVAGFTQAHFFAGIGGWSLAARLAGWPDDRALWSGSCPCQPFSVAGKQRGHDDERHLWPHFFRLIRARRPAVIVGEQVAAAVGANWFDGIVADLESIKYAAGAVTVPACAVDAPQRRDRLWFVAHPCSTRLAQRECITGISAVLGREHERQDVADDDAARGVAYSNLPVEERFAILSGTTAPASQGLAAGRSGTRPGHVADADEPCACEEWQQRGGEQCWSCRHTSAVSGHVAHGNGQRLPPLPEAAHHHGQRHVEPRGAWDDAEWIVGHDGKARRVKPGIRLLAHGIPDRVGKLRAYGNAIVPQVAAEVLAAYLDCAPSTPMIPELPR